MKEHNSMAIEKNGTGVEDKECMIEKNGTGVDNALAMIEKNGTGIRRLAIASAVAAVLFGGPYAFASEFNGVVNRSGQNITISISDGEFLVSGSGSAMQGYSQFSLSAVELSAGRKSDIRGKIAAEGHGTGVAAEGHGTGVAAEGHGTGVAAEGHGTGVAAEGHGTGVAAEGHGTGVAAEGHGTGVAGVCIAHGGILAEGHGTGVAAEGHGTGVAAEGHGTGVAAEGHGTGVAAEGHGTGVAAEGHGTGVAAEGHGTGVAAEGHGTGVAAGDDRTGAFSRRIELGSGNPLFSLDFPIGEERNIIRPESECSPGSIMLSWGIAEIALNGATASILLYSVDTEGEVFELAALELPVIEQ